MEAPAPTARRRTAAATLLLCAAFAGCKRSPPPGPAPEVLLAGCAGVGTGFVCSGPDESVTLWVATAPGEAVEVSPGAPSEVVDGGYRIRLKGGTQTTITVAGRQPVTVRFAPDPAETPGRKLHVEGRQANREGRADDALRLLTAAAERQAADGDASGAAVSAEVMSYVYLERAQLAEARAVLARWPAPPEDATAQATHAYFEARIARAGGDTRRALRAFESAGAFAQRLDLPLTGILREQRAMTHLAVGRVDEAVAALEVLAAAADTLPRCQSADVLTNLGWALLASSRAHLPATGEVLARADAAYAECEAATPTWRANTRVNRALWALRSGRRDLAQAYLADAPPDVAPEVQAWAAYVRAHLSPVPAERARALDLLADRVVDAALEALRWRALVDAGEAWEAAGDDAAAVERYARAEAMVDARVMDIPVDEGRGALVEDRSVGAARQVVVLRRLGRLDEAMDVARRARRRLLTTLPQAQVIEQLAPEQRARWEAALTRYRQAQAALAAEASADWELSDEALATAQAARARRRTELRTLLDAALLALGDQGTPAQGALRRPEPGQVLVTWMQRPDGGWMVLAQDADHTTIADVVPPAWTAPVQSTLAGRQLVRVLAVGPMVDAALDLGESPAVYALDLPPRPARTRSLTATLVADPTGDLAGARQEADRVAALLAAARFETRRITGAAGTQAAIREALGAASHFHYAGHGRYAGREGWDSALPVRDGLLELGELLLLPKVPATLVLSGCETGRAEGGAAMGLGLAHAFLLRGADAVVAPLRPVPDTQALELGEALYGALAHAPTLEAAFHTVAGRPAAADYRLFVP